MIREEIQEAKEDFVTWLKSVGCIIYLPLTENNFTDVITGNTLQFSNNGSVTWDSNKGMYLIKNPSKQGLYIATLSFPYGTSDFVNNSFTKVWTSEKKSTSGAFCLIGSSSGSGWSGPNLNQSPGTAGVSIWSSGINTYLFVEGSFREAWQNGVIDGHSDNPYTPYRPSNWASTNTLYFGVTPSNDSINTEVWCKDVAYFNRALTTDEIIKYYSFL